LAQTCNFLVIGGGVVGLSIALELRSRDRQSKVVVLEKEASCGAHASGRNSGVLHSGVYYTAESLKAKLTKEGNRRFVAYCEEKKIPVRRCGKLIVARSEREHGMLDELMRRGAANGVEVQNLSQEDARRIEPRAKTAGRALFVSSTSSVDPSAVMRALEADCRALGIEIQTSTKYLSLSGGDSVRTSSGPLSPGYVINCAGLYADKIALDFGFSKRFRILPFKGLYLESEEPAESLRCHVYPVPSASNPFLGIHATVKADGRWKIGPTAIPHSGARTTRASTDSTPARSSRSSAERPASSSDRTSTSHGSPGRSCRSIRGGASSRRHLSSWTVSAPKDSPAGPSPASAPSSSTSSPKSSRWTSFWRATLAPSTS
jgi:L-2-hydroxyglutarate oxidase